MSRLAIRHQTHEAFVPMMRVEQCGASIVSDEIDLDQLNRVMLRHVEWDRRVRSILLASEKYTWRRLVEMGLLRR
jgi:hypothetical protein